MRQLEGTVKFDQGQIDNAKLQLIYSRITAPISGRIGLRPVDPGNIVHATDTTGLAVITQLEPITVIFTIPEDNLPAVLARLKAGAHLPVDAYNREQTKKIATGSLLTIDNQIDPNSGTVRFRAEFPNQGPCAVPQPVRQCPATAGDQARGDAGAHGRHPAQPPGNLRLPGKGRSDRDGAPGAPRTQRRR